jgi:hypothetical protein
MNGPLAAGRKPAAAYNKSPSLYGGDQAIDDDLARYFSASSSSSKRRSSAKHKGKAAKASNKRSHSSLSFSSSFASSLEEADEAEEVVAQAVQGSCMDIEKDYYRLTSAPVSSAVRPMAVLVKALKRVKEQWKANKDYPYCCNQLKVASSTPITSAAHPHIHGIDVATYVAAPSSPLTSSSATRSGRCSPSART